MRNAATHDRWLAHALRHIAPTSGAWRLAHKLREWRRTMPHIHPRQSWMAGQLGVTDRTIRRWIVELETAAGCVVVTRHRPHHGPGGHWRRRTNSYRPCFREKRPRPIERKVLVVPTGHLCPQDAPSGASEIAAGGSPPPPPAPPPWLALGITRSAWLEELRE